MWFIQRKSVIVCLFDVFEICVQYVENLESVIKKDSSIENVCNFDFVTYQVVPAKNWISMFICKCFCNLYYEIHGQNYNVIQL